VHWVVVHRVHWQLLSVQKDGLSNNGALQDTQCSKQSVMSAVCSMQELMNT
jgi:hypothetical protein